MLRARLAVAAIGLPLLGLLIAAPATVFAAAVTIVTAAAAYELVRAANNEWPRYVPLSAAVATAMLVAWARQLDDFPLWALLGLPAIALYGLLRPGPGPRHFREAWWLGAVMYVGVLGAHWVLLRDIDDGRLWVLVLLGVTFATDTGAYAVGRLLGSHLMAPVISPGKTWEGFAGGYVAGIAAAIGIPLALDLDPGPVVLALSAATLPVAAVIGDLAESALKRRIGVKDTSALLPGHGGLLDRMDSLLFAGPCLYWILQWV
ncbi:MAG: phosphatidate cytidylyltransferase [Chloroflexi bacterium]|nr:phosphatidate cytidylyltransferase [Chloroflexota bacterium]